MTCPIQGLGTTDNIDESLVATAAVLTHYYHLTPPSSEVPFTDTMTCPVEGLGVTDTIQHRRFPGCTTYTVGLVELFN